MNPVSSSIGMDFWAYSEDDQSTEAMVSLAVIATIVIVLVVLALLLGGGLIVWSVAGILIGAALSFLGNDKPWSRPPGAPGS